MSDLLAVLGGCGGIGRSVVQGALELRFGDAGLDLPASLAAHPLPEDIADPILFLLSDPAGYITWQTLYTNGGAFMP